MPMIARKPLARWQPLFWSSLVALLAIILVALVTRMWVLTALPVGFLFGFCLQRGDLCSAAAFSEVLLLRDSRKIVAIWLLIAVSMLGFALLQSLGLVQLNPKPLLWARQLVGGLIFGSGMVLAGGCISGSLFKTGMGNLNSMASLVGIPLGIGAVLAGPLNALHVALGKLKLTAADGGPVTFSSLTSLPFWVLAVISGLATLVVVLWHRRRHRGAASRTADDPGPSRWQRILTRPWRPWQAGLAIGVLAAPAYLSSLASGRNYPLGVTNGVYHLQQLLIDSQARIVWWLVLVVIGLVIGAWVAARLSGQARLLPKPPEQIVIAFGGGILVGIGAALAGGCYVGNILSGLALMSVGMVVFTAATILANWTVTWLYLMGGWQR
jgi:uncharacterized protein